MATKVTVKTGQTLAQIAKANNTTVAAILADPANKVIAERVAAGTTPVFGNSKVAIPVPNVAPVDKSKEALSVLTSGGTLTDEQRAILGLAREAGSSTPNVTPDVLPNEPAGKPGAAWIWNGTKWSQPAKPAVGNYNWDNELGWTPVTAVPGATGGNVFAPERVLAQDTFANTFALAFGANEASKSYVKKLYELTSSFYKSGSNMDESINLAIRKARVDNEIPEFTQRFKGLFALDDMLKAGKLVKVPTVAEYIASENQIAEFLTNAGMPDIATSEVIGEVLGKGKSVSEVGRILTGAFAAIDNAPDAFKKVLSEKYPTVTRTGLAQALIGGTAGAAALEKEIKNLGVIASARQQGVNISATQAANIAALNYDYQSSLSGMATVAQTQGTYQKLEEISRGQRVTDAGSRVAGAVFEKNAADISAIDALTQQEIGRYSGRSGRLASKDRAQGLI
jgi:hypothetical protein